jgi:hypothetical protein
MKKVVLIGFGIFLAAALAGYFLAAASGHLPPLPARLPFMKNTNTEQQQKVLVVLVDDLKTSEPVVESIWMIYTYPESQPYLVFLPVYSLRDRTAHPDIQAGFKYGFLGKISTEFWDSINNAYDLHWDQYLLLDNPSAALMIESITGKKAPKLFSQPPNLKKPADFQAAMTKYIKVYCSLLKSEKKEISLSETWATISPEFQTDMDREKLKDSWAWFGEHPLETPCNIVSSK